MTLGDAVRAQRSGRFAGTAAPWTATALQVLDRREVLATAKDSEAAERIAACVNACRGVPTSELDSGVLVDLLAHCDQAFGRDEVGQALLKRIRGKS
jgi:hypothetical protein